MPIADAIPGDVALSDRERGAVLEIACLTLAADRVLHDEEARDFRAIAHKRGSTADVDAILARYEVGIERSESDARLRELATYLTSAPFGAIEYSGSWNKWYRPPGGGWTGPFDISNVNFFGTSCSAPYAWCTEWGFGDLFLWIDPAATTTCELSNDSVGCGNGGRLRIRVGGTRITTCGF